MHLLPDLLAEPGQRLAQFLARASTLPRLSSGPSMLTQVNADQQVMNLIQVAWQSDACYAR